MRPESPGRQERVKLTSLWGQGLVSRTKNGVVELKDKKHAAGGIVSTLREADVPQPKRALVADAGDRLLRLTQLSLDAGLLSQGES